MAEPGFAGPPKVDRPARLEHRDQDGAGFVQDGPANVFASTFVAAPTQMFGASTLSVRSKLLLEYHRLAHHHLIILAAKQNGVRLLVDSGFPLGDAMDLVTRSTVTSIADASPAPNIEAVNPFAQATGMAATPFAQATGTAANPFAQATAAAANPFAQATAAAANPFAQATAAAANPFAQATAAAANPFAQATGASVKQPTSQVNIWDATRACDLAVVQKLILSGEVHVDAKTEDGAWPLQLACNNGLKGWDVVRWLVWEAGADLEAPDYNDGKTGNRVLSLALPERMEDAKWLVREKGVDVNIRSRIGRSVLADVVRGQYGSKRRLEIAEWLVREVGADGAIADDEGETALHFACSPFTHINCEDEVDPLPLVQLLVRESGVDINVPVRTRHRKLAGPAVTARTGATPLHTACCGCNRPQWERVVKWLVAEGADVNIQSHDGWTPLMSAAATMSLEMMRWFVREAHADPSLTNSHGETVLHLLCGYGRLELVQWLVKEEGMPVHTVARNGESMLQATLRSGHSAFQVVQWLVQEGGAGRHEHLVTVLCQNAMRNSMQDVVRFLLREPAASVDRGAMLRFAATQTVAQKQSSFSDSRREEKQLVMVRCVFDEVFAHPDANTAINSTDPETGNTALHICLSQAWDLAQWLVDAGANVTVKNSMGESVADLCRDNLNPERKKTWNPKIPDDLCEMVFRAEAEPSLVKAASRV